VQIRHVGQNYFGKKFYLKIIVGRDGKHNTARKIAFFLKKYVLVFGCTEKFTLLTLFFQNVLKHRQIFIIELQRIRSNLAHLISKMSKFYLPPQAKITLKIESWFNF
jgi:hypothetical protein